MTTIKVGLDALNIQDSQHLKNSLINCDDPLKAISDFQEENSILLPTLKSALNLLDLHNVKRLEFHASIADELKDNLVKRIEELTASINSPTVSKEQHNEDLRKLEELLDKSFPLINLPRLTSLIMLIMKALPKINDIYLNYMKDNEALYSIASIEVKRQIWSLHTDVFQKELQPNFDKFITYFDELITNVDLNQSHQITPPTLNLEQSIIRESLLLNSTLYPWFFKTHKKHHAAIAEICRLIGTSRRLYEFTVSSLSGLYAKTHDWFYSTLKSQIVVKLAEMHNNESLMSLVASGDSDVTNEMVYKFSNLINGCLKEKKIEAKRAKELETIMESKKFDKILPEVAFILADPFVIDMLARNAMSLLNRCVQNELLPRNCTELIFVLRVLSISLLSWELIDTQATKEPKIDASLITEYLPSLAYFIADFYEKIYDDSLNAPSTPVVQPTTPISLAATSILTSPTANILSTTSSVTTPTTPVSLSATVSAPVRTSPPIVLKISTRKLEIIASIKTQVVENELCAVLFLYLVVVCFELNDWANLKVILPSIKYPSNNTNLFEKWFMYQIFNMLTEKSLIEQFKNDWFVSLIFDDFLFAIIKQKDDLLQQQQQQSAAVNSLNSTVLYEQTYRLVDKIFPAYLSPANFTRVIDFLKPKKFVSSLFTQSKSKKNGSQFHEFKSHDSFTKLSIQVQCISRISKLNQKWIRLVQINESNDNKK